MLTDEFARHFAAEWIAAWNARDLPRVLAHYRDDFEMGSPLIAQIAGEPSGVLRGKPAIAAYWQAALARFPDLHFSLQQVCKGAESIVLVYSRAGGGTAAEVFYFDGQGLVYRSAGHYAVVM
jgi:hypothetical protein